MPVAAAYRRLLGNRRFLAFFLASAAGDAGYAVYAIAILWLSLEVSGSLVIAGVVLFVEFGVYALSFVVGPLVDRVRDLRSVLLAGYPAQAALAVTLGLLARAGTLTVPILLALVLAISLLWDFTYAATLAVLPRLVSADDLFAANGLASAVSGGQQIGGYAVGAVLLVVVGPGDAAVLYGALNAVAAAFVLGVSAPAAPPARAGFVAERREGFRHLRATRDPPLASLAGLNGVRGFVGGGPAVLIAFVAAHELSGSSAAYGGLFCAFAVGGVVTGLALGALSPRAHVGWVLLVAPALEGAVLLFAVATGPHLLLGAVAWFAVGALDVVFFATLVTVLQATTPRPLLARTVTDVYLPRGAARAFGALAIAALTVVLSPLALAAVIASVLVAAGAGGGVAFPKVRRLRF